MGFPWNNLEQVVELAFANIIFSIQVPGFRCHTQRVYYRDNTTMEFLQAPAKILSLKIVLGVSRHINPMSEYVASN